VRNLVPAHYRSVAVADVDVDLDEASLRAWFIGREAYRRTGYIVVRRGESVAVVRVAKTSEEELFSPIVDVELLAGPDECAFIDSPQTDVGVPTQMAAAARTLAPAARCVVVAGRYQHISFIVDPQPLAVRVVEVAPPLPAKLLDQVQRLLDVAEELPPIELRPEVVDLVALAERVPAPRYLFPCRGSGAAPPAAEVSYLDQRPAREDWVLVGCARSRQFHRWFYGDTEPPNVDICPRLLAASTAPSRGPGGGTAGGGPAGGPTLTKCCLLEEGVLLDGDTVVVPWGASLDEVREGLRQVARMAEAAETGARWAPA